LIVKLDDFLRIATPREIISHSGKVSHKIALDKARLEYQKHQELLKSEDVSLVEQHFHQVIKEVKKSRLLSRRAKSTLNCRIADTTIRFFIRDCPQTRFQLIFGLF